MLKQKQKGTLYTGGMLLCDEFPNGVLKHLEVCENGDIRSYSRVASTFLKMWGFHRKG